MKGKLMDCKQIQLEYGLKRAAAEAVMQKIPKVRIEGVRRVYVRRADVERLIEESTSEP